MQLSEQANAALERIRSDVDWSELCSPRPEREMLLDIEACVNEMLRLFPVKTLNGMVIRWDDEITPEAMVASGWNVQPCKHKEILHVTCGTLCMEIIWGSRTTWTESWKEIPPKLVPSNMNEVWQLMAKCGCPVGGGE